MDKECLTDGILVPRRAQCLSRSFSPSDKSFGEVTSLTPVSYCAIRVVVVVKAKISVVLLLINIRPVKDDICSLDLDESKCYVEWAVATVSTKELASTRTYKYLGTPFE